MVTENWRRKRQLLLTSLMALGCWLILLGTILGQDAEPAFDWTASEELAPGVQYSTLEREYPNAEGLACPSYLFFNAKNPRKLKLYVVRIDTQTPNLKLVTTGRAQEWGQPMPDFEGQVLREFTIRTQRQTTRSFVTEQRQRGIPVLLAINAAPWSPFQSGVTHPYADKMGLAISQGEVVCPTDGRPSLVRTTDGKFDLIVVQPDTNLETIDVAVSGFSFCLTNGEPCEVDSTLHPRTGIGLCRDKRYLYFLLCDGRQASSQGATVHEVGRWLKHYGAHTGLNMDGGGSTTLVQWDETANRAKILNRTAHGERFNGSNLGVYFSSESP